MNSTIAELAPQIWSEIDKANKILLSLHVGPDLDSVGSVLAMKQVLEGLGKKVTAITGDDIPTPSLKFLSGFDTFKRQNLTDVNMSDYDLYILLDISTPSQATKKIELKIPLPIKSINIDHHSSSSPFADINLIQPEFSSTSEILFNVLKLSPHKVINPDVALCLYMGMWSDTGGFRFPSTSSKTYEVAAELINYGIDFSRAIGLALSSPVRNARLLGYGLLNIESHFKGKVIITKIPNSIYKELGFTPETASTSYHSISNEISNCSDYSIAAVIHERVPGMIGISLRSNNPLDRRDVSKVAVAMGGGGHMYASATKVQGTVESAQELLFKTIQEIYPELGQP